MWHWINNLVLCSHILNCGLRKKLTSLRSVISINELKQLSSSGLEKSLSYYWVSDFISTEDLVNNWAYLTAFSSVCIFEHVFLSWACETAEDKRFLWKNWDAQSYYKIIEGKSIKWLKLVSKSKANRSALHIKRHYNFWKQFWFHNICHYSGALRPCWYVLAHFCNIF